MNKYQEAYDIVECKLNSVKVECDVCQNLCDYQKALCTLQELIDIESYYSHADFIISEILVEESKKHIETDVAIKKIRETLVELDHKIGKRRDE